MQPFLRSGRQQPIKPRADQRIGLRHDPIDQFLAGRDIVNQPCDQAAGPGADIDIAVECTTQALRKGQV